MGLREELNEAWDMSRARYWKRQQFILRSMNVHGKKKIPIIPSKEIFELFSTAGTKKIAVERFLNEYYNYVDGVLDKEWNGAPIKPHLGSVEYAEAKGYDVVFHQGDINRNPYYDPTVKCISIYD